MKMLLKHIISHDIIVISVFEGIAVDVDHTWAKYGPVLIRPTMSSEKYSDPQKNQ